MTRIHILMLVASLLFCACSAGSGTDPCERITCSGHGTCSVENDQAICICDEGYAGDLCDDTDPCERITCSGHGTCDSSSGAAVCICVTGYTGDACDACDTDYQDNDGDGTCLPDCSAQDCSGQGACYDSSGASVCICDYGYDGDQCADCASGYSDEGGVCVLDHQCLENTCSGHGTCDDTTGVPICTCDEGYTATHCEACDTGYQDNDRDGTCLPGEPEDPDIEIVRPPAFGDGSYILDFGAVVTGVEVARSVDLRNVGTQELQILDLVFETGMVGDFYLDQATMDSLPIPVAPGGETAFDVYFVKSECLDEFGVLAIISNDPDEARVPIQIMPDSKCPACIDVIPSALNFGDVLTGDQARLDLNIYNAGSDTGLTIEGIQFASLSSEQFELVDLPEFPYSLCGNPALVIGVVFHPTEVGEHADRVMILSDDMFNPQLEVDAIGRGVS